MILHNLTKVRWFRFLLRITYPFAAILFFPLLTRKRKGSVLIFFFDRYSIGGAQKIHLDILESVKDIPKTVYFTRKSPDNKLKEVFYSVPNSRSEDIHFWCDNLLFRLFSVHYYSFLLNSYARATIMSSNSTFFYDMLPFISKRHPVYELLHNFTYGKKGMEFFGLAGYKYITKRMVYDTFTYQNMLEQYDKYHVPAEYKSRINFVEYGVDIPDSLAPKEKTPPLKVLYAGRGAAQKRIWLLNRVAEYFIQRELPVEFTFAGSMAKELSTLVKENSTVYNEIGEQEKMIELFRRSHAIILTSAFEGFPVVIKESMCYGCIPVVTGLPGNKSHLTHLSNALLMENYEDEELVVRDGIQNIELLIDRPDLVEKLSASAYHYASAHFTKHRFIAEYRQMLTWNLA